MNRRPQAASSLCDTDFYKLTMAQFAWRRHRGVRVKYRFTNRTNGVALAERVDLDELREQLAFVRRLKFQSEELAWLADGASVRGPFDPAYLGFLAKLELPEISVERDGGTFRIETEGEWCEAIWWETFVLSTVNELYARSVVGDDPSAIRAAHDEGMRRLDAKIAALAAHPEIRLVEFGTRRRFSTEWQEVVLNEMDRRLPRGMLAGTSNVGLARRYGLKPFGTMAHEVFMVYGGLYRLDMDELVASHNRVLRDWWEEYGEPLSVALTDTYGTDFFFRDMTDAQASAWKGLRQDSGDPAAFGERAIAFYEAHGVDPRQKTIVFSDGLDVEAILRLHDRFTRRVNVVFGWGTDLTNDVGPRPLSLVMKAVEAEGKPLVKLSDTLEKATGPKGLIAEIAAAIGYRGGEHRTLNS